MKNKPAPLYILFITIILTSCQSGAPLGKTLTSEPPMPPPTETQLPSPSPTASITPTPTQTSPPPPTPTPTLEPMSSFMQGVFYAAYWEEDFSKPYNPWILENVVKSLGANWISVHFLCEQMTGRSTEIICGENNLTTKTDVENIVTLAHSMGLRVFMEIGITIKENHQQFGVGFSDEHWEAWFDSYEIFITDYAAFAEDLKVDLFSIGSELSPTQHREDNWRAIAAAVRQVYQGPLIYSADSRGTSVSGERWLDIQWWDEVDYIGIHPYDNALSFHNNPTVDEMVKNLTPIVNRLETLSREFNLPVIISELMYPSIDGTSQGMTVLWDRYLTYKMDLEEHADVHRALIQAFSDREWWQGLFIGDYSGGTILNPPGNIQWSMYGKPAEEVLRDFYGGTPQPSPTPFATPQQVLCRRHAIYEDGFVNQWIYWPPDDDGSMVDSDQTEIAVDGSAIGVTMNYWSSIWIEPPMGFPVSEYDWITFDLYVTEDKVWNPEHGNFHPINILMVLFGGPNNATPFRVIFTDPPYLEGGIRANEWMTVQIPLDAFGPLVVPEIVAFSMQNISENTIRIYIDNLMLLKEPQWEE